MTWACFLLSFSCERLGFGLGGFDCNELAHQAGFGPARSAEDFVHDLPGLLRIQVSGQDKGHLVRHEILLLQGQQVVALDALSFWPSFDGSS